MGSSWMTFCGALLLGLAIPSGYATAARTLHATLPGTCDGYPRLDIQTVPGMCAGRVLGPTADDPTRALDLPRSLVQLDDRTWLVTDLGAWNRPRGAVWKMSSRPGEATRMTRLLTGLNLPHAIAIGPDGRVYVGEMSRIFRFDPDAPHPAGTVETVIAGLPDNKLHENRHPLSKFVFDSDGALLVNIGAPSDQCLAADGKPPGATCPVSDTGEQAASLRRYARTGPASWSADYSVHARGLRNSLALAVHRSGTVLQAENSYDFAARWTPFEEINVIQAGRHYGWPYCADMATPTPGWRGTQAMDCRSNAHSAPAILLPPHAAPLDMLWYDGAMFPALQGRLLISWHGHRSVGGRIVAYRVDARGVPVPDRKARFPVYGGTTRAFGAAPSATPVVLTPGWGLVENRRPQGSPVGLAVARDGALWATDDRAGLVIRFAEESLEIPATRPGS